jgi:hypothetical protein
VPEWLNGAVSKTVVVLWATVGSNPTLSAGQEKTSLARLLRGLTIQFSALIRLFSHSRVEFEPTVFER